MPVSSKRDYYEVLGVPKNADVDTIKRSYRKIALKFHPDKNPGNKQAEESFKEAAEAYEVLSDQKKRQAYDQFGHAGVGGAGGGPQFGSVEDIFRAFGDIFGGGRSGGGSSGGSMFEDLFGGFGGGGGGGRRSRQAGRGAHLKVDLEINLEDVLKGVKKKIEISRNEICTDCSGSGAKKGTKPTSCAQCGGHGYVVQQQGFFAMRGTCSQCRGTGEVVKDPCKTCRGGGRVPREREVTVTIPPGIENGMQLRLTGEGEAGPRGGPRGDLYVEIHVKQHELFRRSGDDILLDVPIGFSQAALGAEIEVPTLKGKSKLTVPRGAQSSTTLRMRGLGLPRLDGYGVGNQLVRVIVEVPTKLNKEQEDLLRTYAELEERQVGTKQKGFWDKVREIFE